MQCHRPGRLLILFILVLLILVGGCTRSVAPLERRYWVAPTVLPGVVPDMKTAGFWIGRLDHPNEILLDREGIAALNRDIRERLGLTKDVAGMNSVYDGNELRGRLQRSWQDFAAESLFGADGRAVGAGFYELLAQAMDWESIASTVTVRFGLVVAHADQRLLPTTQPLYAEQGDIDFDELQNNALDIGTPVAVLHQTRDGRWLYVLGPSSDGWLRSERVALCSRGDLRDFTAGDFVTVTQAKGCLYGDQALTRYTGFARMGTRLFVAPGGTGDTVAVRLPTRGPDGGLEVVTGYLKPDEVTPGCLDYTPRHIIEQAFALLNAPYGWGGIQGEQDCSQFIQEVFATMGIHLPRNSVAQAQVGRVLADLSGLTSEQERFDRLINHAMAGTTVLAMKGHVMLYLGQVEGRPYAIHELWGYREPEGDTVRVINRVAVTDLSLGRGASKGSLLERTETARGMY